MVSSLEQVQRREGKGIIFLLIVSALILFSAVTEGTLFSTVYLYIFVFIIGSLGLMAVFPNFIEYKTMPVRKDNVFMSILAGFGLGVALVGGIYGVDFALLSPLNSPDVSAFFGVVGFGLVGQVFLQSVVVSELEESLFSGLFKNTFAEWLRRSDLVQLVFGILAVLLFFLGFQLYALAIVGLITLGKSTLLAFFRDESMRKAMGIAIAGIFFGAMHLTAYGGAGVATDVTNSLVLNAIMFFVIANIINEMMGGSTISSKVAHTMNNATLAVTALAMPIYFALIVTGIYATILGWSAGASFKDIKI